MRRRRSHEAELAAELGVSRSSSGGGGLRAPPVEVHDLRREPEPAAPVPAASAATDAAKSALAASEAPDLPRTPPHTPPRLTAHPPAPVPSATLAAAPLAAAPPPPPPSPRGLASILESKSPMHLHSPELYLLAPLVGQSLSTPLGYRTRCTASDPRDGRRRRRCCWRRHRRPRPGGHAGRRATGPSCASAGAGGRSAHHRCWPRRSCRGERRRPPACRFTTPARSGSAELIDGGDRGRPRRPGCTVPGAGLRRPAMSTLPRSATPHAKRHLERVDAATASEELPAQGGHRAGPRQHAAAERHQFADAPGRRQLGPRLSSAGSGRGRDVVWLVPSQEATAATPGSASAWRTSLLSLPLGSSGPRQHRQQPQPEQRSSRACGRHRPPAGRHVGAGAAWPPPSHSRPCTKCRWRVGRPVRRGLARASR